MLSAFQWLFNEVSVSMAFHPENKRVLIFGTRVSFFGTRVSIFGTRVKHRIYPTSTQPVQSHPRAVIPSACLGPWQIKLRACCHSAATELPPKQIQMDWPDGLTGYILNMMTGLAVDWPDGKGQTWCKPAITLSLKASQSKKTIISWKCKYHTRYSIGIPGFTK